MKYVTLGVIGHVDHGKTALVKALTGVDTDRLAEEKSRGISIVLGYSHLELPHGQIGIVDAPGHEKFIRTMISGATGIDAVLLAVDVNEGVKPQTVEHLDIAELLGVQRGVVAVTKCDTADPAMQELAAEEVRELVQDTFLKDAPIVLTSALKEIGLDELRESLDAIVADWTPQLDEGCFFLPIDRVFSMSGFGTVVTGTLRRGAIRAGDTVEIYPKRIIASVRDLQSHNESVTAAEPGHRTAVNLRGLEKVGLKRGDVLATPGSVEPASVLDVRLRALGRSETPVKQNQMLRVLFGTIETYGRVHFLDRDELAPGGDCVAQIQCDEPIPFLTGEPFVVRTYSPLTTVGGGRILGGAERRYRRRDGAARRFLETLAAGSQGERAAAILHRSGRSGVSMDELARKLRHPMDETQSLEAVKSAVSAGGARIVELAVFQALCNEMEEVVSRFHHDHPTERGLPSAQLDKYFANPLDDALKEVVFAHLESQETIAVEAGVIRLASFDPAGGLSGSDRALAEDIEDAYKQSKWTPPPPDDVLENRVNGDRILKYLIDRGVLVIAAGSKKTKTGRPSAVFHRDAVDEAKSQLKNRFNGTGRFTVPEAKDVLGLSRKYMIPLLEHLDAIGFTRRGENERIIQRNET